MFSLLEMHCITKNRNESSPISYHLLFRIERSAYYARRDLAKDSNLKQCYKSFIIDGMDQKKTSLPNFIGRKSKVGTYHNLIKAVI